MVPEKVGLKSVQRDGLEYEFTLVFDLDIKNHATASKDRTGLFFGKPEQKITVATGKLIRDWCNTGSTASVEDVMGKINSCSTIAELLDVYKQHMEYRDILKPSFEQRKRQIILQGEDDIRSELVNTLKINSNGTAH